MQIITNENADKIFGDAIHKMEKIIMTTRKELIIRELMTGKKPYQILKDHPGWSDWVYKVAREWRRDKLKK